GEICPGPQPPLIDRELFEAVQRRLTEQRTHHLTTRTTNDAPLKGILFDAAGDPMGATHATKRGVRDRRSPICAGLPRCRWERLFVFLLRTLNIPEIGEGLHVVELCRGDDGANRGPSLSDRCTK